MNKVLRTSCAILLAAMLIAESHGAVKKIEPVEIVLGQTERVFVQQKVSVQQVESVEQMYSNNRFLLDSLMTDKNGEALCRQVEADSYTDLFRFRNVSADELRALKAVSPAELLNRMGEPISRNGPIDSQGTVVWEWRTYRRTDDGRFEVIALIAGIRGGESAESVFLFLKVGRAERGSRGDSKE